MTVSIGYGEGSKKRSPQFSKPNRTMTALSRGCRVIGGPGFISAQLSVPLGTSQSVTTQGLTRHICLGAVTKTMGVRLPNGKAKERALSNARTNSCFFTTGKDLIET